MQVIIFFSIERVKLHIKYPEFIFSKLYANCKIIVTREIDLHEPLPFTTTEPQNQLNQIEKNHVYLQSMRHNTRYC